MALNEPHIKDKTESTDISDRLEKFLTDLRARVEEDDKSRYQWKRKLITSNNQRMGLKRVSNRPWPGAPNIPLPEADKLISKKKPNYVLSVLIPKIKAFVEPSAGMQVTDLIKEKARKAQLGLNYVLNNKIDLMRVFSLGADNKLEKGHAIYKVTERFEKRLVHRVVDLSNFPKTLRTTIDELRKLKNDELRAIFADREGLDLEDDEDKKIVDDVLKQFRDGKEILEYDIPVIESWPDVEVRPPEQVTPPPFALGIDTLDRLSDEFFLTKRELIEGARSGVYKKETEEIVKEHSAESVGGTASSPQTQNDMIETQKDRNEGVTEFKSRELFKIKQVFTWWQEEEDGDFERWVFTFLDDIGDTRKALIQKIKFPYEFKTWNYVKDDAEIKDARWYSSRGIPERIRALQEFMEKAINNMLIRDEINNAPVYTVLSTSRLQANSVRFIPGQKLKVGSHNEISRIDDINKVDISSERVQQLLKAYAEEYLSSNDQLFRNSTNQGGGKTLGEVQLGVQSNQAPVTLDIMLWLDTVKKIYTMVFELMRERMGESIFINDEEITREDFNFDATVTPNGSIDLVESAVRTQKALNRMTIQAQLGPDIVTPEDRYNAAKDFFEADGAQNPDKFITEPNIVRQQMKEQMMAEDQVLAQQEQEIDAQIAETRGRATQEAAATARIGGANSV